MIRTGAGSTPCEEKMFWRHMNCFCHTPEYRQFKKIKLDL